MDIESGQTSAGKGMPLNYDHKRKKEFGRVGGVDEVKFLPNQHWSWTHHSRHWCWIGPKLHQALVLDCTKTSPIGLGYHRCDVESREAAIEYACATSFVVAG